MPIRMKVSNCNEYNKFLQERGNVFHYINDAIENWYENSPKVAGGNNVYSDKSSDSNSHNNLSIQDWS
ncbi:hypothetical protein [Wolbachia endosymbiont of Chrysomya megacephala]|uniref:hypothetical protein n=1 Tax=Wolbachia endosymbiont of Chrysomya megacephala TaxID=1335053 RepID=UPI001FE4C2DC|nr:hypothetical protein [Wolbachia endosymbiont of Chrysomya megacephala]